MNCDSCHGDHIHKPTTTPIVSVVNKIVNACHQGSVLRPKTTGHQSCNTNSHRFHSLSCQQVTKPIPVVVTTTRISRPTGLTCNNTFHTGAPSSNMNNLTHIICNTDLLRSADKTVNTKLTLINTWSIRNKADYIKDYIVEHHIDIVALTETWLSHDDKVEINVLTAGDYNLCHLPCRNHRGGGIGLLFKSTFNMISEAPLTTDTLEGLSVTLQCPETNSNVRIYRHLPSTVVISVPWLLRWFGWYS